MMYDVETVEGGMLQIFGKSVRIPNLKAGFSWLSPKWSNQFQNIFRHKCMNNKCQC